MGCNCGGGQAAKSYQAAPRNAPVQTFEGPQAQQQAQLYVARNGGGHVREVQPAVQSGQG